ncbi:MAG: Flp family type IVb pilin [Pseudomonadota bacterium]
MKFSKFFRDADGATAVEYGLIAALMTLALIGALSSTGGNTGAKWDGVSDQIVDATT